MARFSKDTNALLNRMATAPREFIVSKKGSEMASKAATLVEREHPEEADDFLVELVMLGYHPSGYVGSGPANIYGGKRKYKRLEENPSGGAWALGIAAVLVGGWLLLRKKDEPKTTPSTGTPPISPPVVTVTPTNTTSPREGTTPPTTPVIDFVPFFPAPCTFTSEQFDTWAKNNGKQAFWFQSAGMPPNVKDLPGADPLIAAQYVIASGNGALVWVYGAGGAPVVSPIVRNAVCKSLGFVTE